jgi:hypothetical protein
MPDPHGADDSTGLPVLSSWRAIYLLVVIVFIILVVAMVVLERMYS